MSPPLTYTRNLSIKNLPIRVNNQLNALAKLRGEKKWEIVRKALIEYAQNHREEFKDLPDLNDLDEEIEENGHE